MPANPLDDITLPGTVRIVHPTTGELWVIDLDEMNNTVFESIVGSFPPKQVFGDWQREHHEWLSSFVQSDWSGGGQRTISQEATDTSRYAGIATLETKYPKQVTLLPLANEVAGPNTTGCLCLGDLQQSFGGAVGFWAAFGDKLCSVDGATVGSPTTLGALPVNRGVSFRGSAGSARRLYIPMGASGYQAWDPSGPTLDALTTGTGPGSTNVKPLNFLVWDNKVWCITTEGRILRNSTGAANGWDEVLRIDTEGDPKSLVRFVDQLGLPCLYVITSREILVIDVGAATSYVIHEYAPHPFAGTAAERWDVGLYFSHGIDLGLYDTSLVRFIGLARDDGVPAELRGHVVSLASAWNGMYALIQGRSETEDVEGFETDSEGDLLLPDSLAKSGIMVLDRFGAWHTLWTSSNPGDVPTNCVVSAAGGNYRLYWGFGGNIWYTELSEDFQNPLANPTAEFMESGRLTSSWLDMNRTGMDMILASVDVRYAKTSIDDTITVRLQYEKEDNPEEFVGTLSWEDPLIHGMTPFRVGFRETMPDGTAWYEGRSFGQVRYIIDMARGPDASKSPSLESIALVFMPKMGTLSAWRFTVDAQAIAHRAGHGHGPKAVIALFKELIEEKFFPFSFRENEWHIVKLAGSGGPQAPANRNAGYLTISLIETFEQ